MSLPEDSLLSISFEGTELPSSMYWLELTDAILGTVSPELTEWLLDLHYCGGIERSAASEDIVLNCGIVQRRLDSKEMEVLNGLSARVPDLDAKKTVAEWRSGLQLMEKLALGRVRCHWSRPVTGGAIAQSRSTLRFLLGEFIKEHGDPGKEMSGLMSKADSLSDGECFSLLQDFLAGLSRRSK